LVSEAHLSTLGVHDHPSATYWLAQQQAKILLAQIHRTPRIIIPEIHYEILRLRIS
jgi:hypothetical protein